MASYEFYEHGVVVTDDAGRKVLLTTADALHIAQNIQAKFCKVCYRGDLPVNDAGECVDCARFREALEDDERYACQICGQPGGH